MRVVLLYRRRREGAHSIETLFHAIAAELREQVELIEYEVASRFRAVEDAVRLNALCADVYHVTGDVNYFALLLPPSRTVLTVHDIGNYLHGLRGMKRWLYRIVWLDLPLRLAGTVTSVSEKTRNDIRTHLRLPKLPIEVIPNCYSPWFRPVPKPFHAECPIVLQVGTQPYKNVARVVDALRNIPCHFVIVGPLSEALRCQLSAARLSYTSLVNLSAEALHLQYVESDLVTFVSTGEGFGVPILEAQAVGRALVTSNISPLCNVAGRGACVVDPHSVESIRDGIERLIRDREYRESVVASGLLNVAHYSPAQIARKYLALYERLPRDLIGTREAS